MPLGGAFGRNYDRSGIFSELQFSGWINGARPVETLYWTMGIGGGLGGEINPEKKLWLGDYVHFDRIGHYRINLRYQDSAFEPNEPVKQSDKPEDQRPSEAVQNEIRRLITCTYVYMDKTSKADFGKTVNRLHEWSTDEFWVKKIEKSEHDLAQATNQAQVASLQHAKQYATARLAEKKERDLRLRLINYTMTLLEEQDRGSS